MFVWRVPEQQEGSETLDSGNTVSQKKHDRKINLHNERTRPLTTHRPMGTKKLHFLWVRHTHRPPGGRLQKCYTSHLTGFKTCSQPGPEEARDRTNMCLWLMKVLLFPRLLTERQASNTLPTKAFAEHLPAINTITALKTSVKTAHFTTNAPVCSAKVKLIHSHAPFGAPRPPYV